MKLFHFFCILSLFASTLNAQKEIQTPQAFLPHAPGSQFSRHDQIYDYIQYLASMSQATMRTEIYGQTYEDRPLMVAMFSSPENITNLESIRKDHLMRSGILKGEPKNMKKIAIVWLSMSVHGNEPSGTECSPELAYMLATQTDPKIKEWLRNTIVILDPALNPDGYSRYTNWYRSVSTKHRNKNKEAREHNEPWPSGRVNHYQFDLNRDWAWATQRESASRLVLYHKWFPHIHADLHEQYPDNPYYFPPAAEPMHHLITPFQRKFQETVGQNHAAYFDANKWLYFTREWFDLFYPSYGDTYPMFNGAIGMTYEQAGHSTAGRVLTITNGDTLSLYDRILHHRTTSLSTIEIASKNADQLVDEMTNYFTKARNEGSGPIKTYVLPAGQDQGRLQAFLSLLDKHEIKYGQAGASVGGMGWSFKQNKETNVKIQPDDILISALQPQSNLITVLFQAQSDLSDSLTYDITAWSLPYAYGVEMYSLRQILTPKGRPGFTTLTPVQLPAKPYAWAIDRGSLNQMTCIGRLLQQDVKIRYASKAFSMPDRSFEAGTFVISHADNRAISDQLDSLVQDAANRSGQMECIPLFSSWANQGPNMGSETMILITPPEIALVYGEQVNENSFGHTWHFFEQDLDYPFTDIRVDQINGFTLSKFNTLILADGNYALGDDKISAITEWVKGGGRLVAFDGGAKAFAGKDGFKWELAKADDTKHESGPGAGHYHSAERSGISNSLSGAILETKLDTTHPICAGLGDTYYSLKTNPNLYKIDSSAHNIVSWIGKTPTTYGFIGANVKSRLPETASIAVQKMEGGKAVFFSDNPLFRSFWYQGKIFFANALFY